MKPATLHRMPWLDLPERDQRSLLTREWLVTNGLGGYSSGTVSGACTRRFHGLLIAALPAPWGRYMMFHHLAESLRAPDGAHVQLGGRALSDPHQRDPNLVDALSEFRLENGLPVWNYRVHSIEVEKRIIMPHMQNTVHVSYRLIHAQQPVRLRLRPAFQFRPHEGRVDAQQGQEGLLSLAGDRVQITAKDAPPLRLRVAGCQSYFVHDGGRELSFEYEIERARGYDYQGVAWAPGYFRVDLAPGQEITLSASTEEWDSLLAVEPSQAFNAEQQRRQHLIAQADPAARQGFPAQLVLAADQFIIRPSTRVGDTAVAHATGDHARTVIAGYHWFTDWGRDTMISLEGLTLTTGRHEEAGYLLRTFARYVRDGLIPNLFPEGQNEAVYHTADASLWYFHALSRYLAVTNDQQTLQTVLPVVQDIVDHHLRGTRFGIHIDPTDGLLAQGEEGYQLTWMDAKVGDWVVTPRRGKAVELNALWYNSLRLLEGWQRAAGNESIANQLSDHAARAVESFNRRFWYADGGYLLDVVDGEHGDDTALRPNQLLAISLDHPVLEPARWEQVVTRVADDLLTPYGLRTLNPQHPDYQPLYDGDLRARDAAYHQGTVWTWLLGPFVDAWLRVYPERQDQSLLLLASLEEHLGEACLGTISEIFDAETPFYPRGCAAQAWSVAETLRAWVKCASA